MRKRRPRNIARSRITPAALAAYRAGDSQELHKALNLAPWEVSPLEVSGACPWPPGSAGATTWAESKQLLEDLQCAE